MMTAILCRSCSRLCQKFINASKTMVAASSENSAHRETEKVLVVHPKIRWGQNSRRKNTTTELQIAEAVALCRTLPHLNVAGTLVVGTDDSTKKRMIWGPGRLEKIMEQKHEFGATALMINADMLSPLQQTELTAYFGVPIYDRFNIVLSIFKLYARTKEAHLQIALAELPYIRHRMRFLYARGGNATTDALHVTEAAETLSRGGADAFELLRIRQHALQKQIKVAVESKSTELEEMQAKSKKHGSSAVVAVVGYTNAGKTSLIQKLTDSDIYGRIDFSQLSTPPYILLFCHRKLE
uniref:GTPase HflX N-terminal domain-containing protein n=1 Tax=Ditylenchus dipsaci TaxID=166011 RepID=A0A915CM03_9BILA